MPSLLLLILPLKRHPALPPGFRISPHLGRSRGHGRSPTARKRAVAAAAPPRQPAPSAPGLRPACTLRLHRKQTLEVRGQIFIFHPQLLSVSGIGTDPVPTLQLLLFPVRGTQPCHRACTYHRTSVGAGGTGEARPRASARSLPRLCRGSRRLRRRGFALRAPSGCTEYRNQKSEVRSSSSPSLTPKSQSSTKPLANFPNLCYTYTIYSFADLPHERGPRTCFSPTLSSSSHSCLYI